MVVTSPCTPLALIPNSPDAVATVIGNQDRTIRRNGHTYRAAPLAVFIGIDNEAGEEIFDRARFPVLERSEDDLRSIRRRAIPGAV